MPSSQRYWHLVNVTQMTQVLNCFSSSSLYKKHSTRPFSSTSGRHAYIRPLFWKASTGQRSPPSVRTEYTTHIGLKLIQTCSTTQVIFFPVWRLENNKGQGCYYLGSVVTQVEWIWRRNERKFVRSVIHRIIQWLSTTGHQHGRVNRSHTMMDHDILERRTVSREIQSEGYVWCRSLYVTLEKMKSRSYSKISHSSQNQMFKNRIQALKKNNKKTHTKNFQLASYISTDK